MTRVPYKLPPLPRLRVKNPVQQTQADPCKVLMSSLLQCWASNGQNSKVCEELVSQLKLCGKGNAQVRKSNVNYHAARLYKRVSGNPETEGK